MLQTSTNEKNKIFRDFGALDSPAASIKSGLRLPQNAPPVFHVLSKPAGADLAGGEPMRSF
jgi:hypothetical protein